MKSAILIRLKSRAAPRPITASEALYEWYYQGIEADSRLTPKSKLMLSWLCVLASGQDLAPLWYEISEIGRKFGWPDEQTRQHAEEAAAAGFVELNGELMILTDPRERKSFFIPPL
jgi:hypothetical protein